MPVFPKTTLFSMATVNIGRISLPSTTPLLYIKLKSLGRHSRRGGTARSSLQLLLPVSPISDLPTKAFTTLVKLQ